MKSVDLEKPPGTSGLHILVVEDEALIAMYMEDILVRLGCEVVKAGRIVTGLHLIDTHHIDGAFLDMDVAGASILPVAEGLRSRKVPFAFVTGSGRPNLPIEFRDYSVLSKPLAEQRVAEVVADFAFGARTRISKSESN